MDKIAKISSVQRAELFQQTASKFPFLSEAAIEKDFWVCWILKQVFVSPLKDIVIFKSRKEAEGYINKGKLSANNQI